MHNYEISEKEYIFILLSWLFKAKFITEYEYKKAKERTLSIYK